MLVASAYLDDDAFLDAMNLCALPPDQFRHGDHLRLAWILAHRSGMPEAVDRMRESIQRFAAHHGASTKYHETITRAWVRLIASHDEPSFETFLRDNEDRLRVDLLQQFWSPERLKSDEARMRWIEPDLQPLPV